MPTIVNHASPLTHVIAGLSQGAGDTADAMAEKKQQDAYLAAAAQRLALQQSEEERRKREFDYNMERQPIVDRQNDALADLRTRSLGADTKVREAQAARIGQSDPADAADLEAYDAEIGNAFANLPDTPETQALRAKAQTRRGVLEHYGMEETDPGRRRQLRGQFRQQLVDLTKSETLPFIRSHAEQSISKAIEMGSLKNNPEAQAALPGLLAALKQPGSDPRAVLKDFNDLSTAVRRTSRALAAKEYVYGKLDHFAHGLSDDEALEMQGIMSDLEHDAITPNEALKQAKALALGDKGAADKQADNERADRELDFKIRDKALEAASKEYEELALKAKDPADLPTKEALFAKYYKMFGGRGDQERKEFAGHGMDPFRNMAPGAAPVDNVQQPAPVTTGGKSVVTPEQYNKAFDRYSELIGKGMTPEEAKAQLKLELQTVARPIVEQPIEGMNVDGGRLMRLRNKQRGR